METARADDDELGVLRLRGIDQRIGRIAAEHGDAGARREVVLPRQLLQPSVLPGSADCNGVAALAEVSAAHDVHQRDLAPQIAGQLGTRGDGAVAAARVIDSADDVRAHSDSYPLVWSSLSRALQSLMAKAPPLPAGPSVSQLMTPSPIEVLMDGVVSSLPQV
jgi:hypothetical protein